MKWTGSTVSKPKVRTPNNKSTNVYPRRGQYAKSPSKAKSDTRKKWSGSNVTKPKTQTATGKTKNVFKQTGPYVSNPSIKPQLAEKPPGKKRKMPATASKPFMRRTSINPYAGFWNKKIKGEKAYIGDISGKKLRARNYETPKQPPIKHTASPYMKKKRVDDVSYSGKAAGGYVSATKGPQGWKGDISGRKIRDRNQTSKGKSESGKPLSKLPYTGAQINKNFGKRKFFQTSMSMQGAGFTGYSKASKPQKGGGSVSRKQWNNKGQAIEGKGPGMGVKAGTFQGNIKQQKPFKGGGSVSGKLWNNKGLAIEGKVPRQGGRAAAFQGNIKAQKPFKGGGSVSGKLWNNNGNPVLGRQPKVDAMGNYKGNIKAQKPLKGGGSVSGKLWNNDGNPILGRQPKVDAMGNYQGNIKAQKPFKGGGSVSGKLWNNNEKPIAGREPKVDAMGNYQGNARASKKEPDKEIGGFPGKYKLFDLEPSMRNQGEEFTGHIRRPRLWSDYITHKGTAKASIKKKRPNSNTYAVGDMQVKVKEKEYKKKPNAAKGSMPGIAPGKTSIKASEYARGVKQNWNYIRNQSSDEDALKVKEPGKAFGKTSDYQGNIKMKKFDLFGRKDLHPDAQFVKTNKNNVKEEKNLVTNFKLLWARLFKKNDTQPNHLKENIRKPRYDKDEIGLWNN